MPWIRDQPDDAPNDTEANRTDNDESRKWREIAYLTSGVYACCGAPREHPDLALVVSSMVAMLGTRSGR